MLPERRDIRDGAAWTGLAFVWVTVVIILGGLLAAGLWWFGVFTAGARGTAQVHKDQQSASNREHWSAIYNAEYQQLQADHDNVSALHDAANAPGATQQDRIDYTGALMNCRTDVARYDADTQNTLGAQWLPAGLPTTVNATTICGS